MDEADLRRLLEAGEVVRLSASEWEEIVALVEVVERHPALPGSELLLVRFETRFAAVEQPLPGELVVRPLSGRLEVRKFLERRQVEYERMWNGCGCKIDYDARSRPSSHGSTSSATSTR